MDRYEGHTPGPWGVGPEVRFDRFGGPTIKGTGVTLAVIASGYGRADADAILIAAAPSLLAENARLREVLEPLTSLMERHESGELIYQFGKRLDEAIKAARAALSGKEGA